MFLDFNYPYLDKTSEIRFLYCSVTCEIIKTYVMIVVEMHHCKKKFLFFCFGTFKLISEKKIVTKLIIIIFHDQINIINTMFCICVKKCDIYWIMSIIYTCCCNVLLFGCVSTVCSHELSQAQLFWEKEEQGTDVTLGWVIFSLLTVTAWSYFLYDPD